MPDDTERLVVLLEARIRDFEKNMAKASGTADKSYGRMRRESRSATRQMEADMVRSTSRINQALATSATKIGAMSRAFAVGMAGGAAAALAPMVLLSKALNDIGEGAALQRLADRIGIGTESLQALQYAAAQAGVNVDQMGDGLGDFAAKVAEAASGAGHLAEIFKANGIELRNQNGTLRSTRAILGDFANLIMNAQTPAEQLFLAQQAFGDEAAKMVPIFKDGARGLEQIEINARAAGAVVDADLIKRAEELDKRMQSMWATFSARSKSALLTALTGVDSLIAKIREYENRRAEAQRATEAGAWIGGMVKPEGEALTFGKGDKPTALDARMAGVLATELSEADLKLVKALQDRYAAAASQATIIPSSGGSSGGGGGGGGKTSKDTFKPDADAFAEMIGATQEWREEQELANQTMEEFGNIAINAGRSLVNALQDGKLEGHELLSILADIVTQLLSMQGASGVLGSIFSGILGGGFNPSPTGFMDMLAGFSTGTANTGGQRGEPRGIVHGQEAVIPLPNGGRVPVQLQGGAGGNQPSRSETTIRLVMPQGWRSEIVREARDGSAEDTIRIVADYDRALPDRVEFIRQNPRRR